MLVKYEISKVTSDFCVQKQQIPFLKKSLLPATPAAYAYKIHNTQE